MEICLRLQGWGVDGKEQGCWGEKANRVEEIPLRPRGVLCHLGREPAWRTAVNRVSSRVGRAREGSCCCSWSQCGIEPGSSIKTPFLSKSVLRAFDLGVWFLQLGELELELWSRGPVCPCCLKGSPITGCLGGSVGYVSDSWFRLSSCSHGL